MRTLVSLTTLAIVSTTMTLAAQAQTTPAPGTAPATPSAPGATGGVGDYWWLIVLAVLGAAAIWYFQRGRTGPRL